VVTALRREEAMDLLDIAITTTVKGAVSHYVRNALQRIDATLERLVVGGKHDEIRKYISEHNLQQQISEVANETLRGSFLVPVMPNQIATFADRVELFQHVLQWGFNLSHALQADLLLPGSLYDRDSFTLFRRNEKSVAQVNRSGVRLSIPEGANYTNQVYFIPIEIDQAKEVFEQYKEQMLLHLQENDGTYFKFDGLLRTNDWDNCWLIGMSAGSCVFKYMSLIPNSKSLIKYFQVKETGVQIKNWGAGLEQMISAAAEIPDLKYLSAEEIKEIRDAYELFNRFN
jgi:hypothetical protein